MKRKITLLLSLVFISLAMFTTKGNAQTSGNMTFTVNPVSHNANYGLAHLAAIWVETGSSGAFVKTKLKRTNNSNASAHLAIWEANSGGSTVDATTGATLTSYAPLTVTWSATDVSANVVTDGIYRVLVECAWGNSTTIPTGKDTMSVTFNKSTSTVHLTPADRTNFTGISLDWVPAATAVNVHGRKSGIEVYPSPTSGLINIDFPEAVTGCKIEIVDLSGAVIYREATAPNTLELRNIDLSNNPNGVYYVRIQSNSKSKILNYKVVLMK